MFCHQCGAKVVDNAVSCGSCGATLRSIGQGDTQPMPMPGPTVRMTAAGSDTAPDSGRAAASTAAFSSKELPPTTVIPVVDPATAKIPAPAAQPKAAKNSAPMVMLFGAAVLMGVAAWGAYEWSLGRSGPSPDPAAPAATATATAGAPSSAAPAATSPAPDPTSVPPPGPSAQPPAADPMAGTPAATPAVQPPATGPGSGPALLAAARKERDAAVVQRDAALEQVKQLHDDLARATAAAAAAAVPAATPVSPADAARLTQLQKEHDTVRFVAGTRKQLLADRIIESHLYLLPPPANVTQISLSQTTEINLDAKTYGMTSVKDLVVIPSSVWENTDYKISNNGSSITFTILRPDAFRSFARYFVLMIE